jgi:hypothetical protein
MSEWIPTAERQPDKAGKYLVTERKMIGDETFQTYVTTAVYDPKNNPFLGKWYLRDEVLAWMPLPQVYNAERDQNQ